MARSGSILCNNKNEFKRIEQKQQKVDSAIDTIMSFFYHNVYCGFFFQLEYISARACRISLSFLIEEDLWKTRNNLHFDEQLPLVIKLHNIIVYSYSLWFNFFMSNLIQQMHILNWANHTSINCREIDRSMFLHILLLTHNLATKNYY